MIKNILYLLALYIIFINKTSVKFENFLKRYFYKKQLLNIIFIMFNIICISITFFMKFDYKGLY